MKSVIAELALDLAPQAVREQFGGFSESIAIGLNLRPDCGSQFLSDDFRRKIRPLGLESSPAFAREPEGNGCIERFFRPLREQLLWVRLFHALEGLAEALKELRERCNQHRLVERMRFQSPRQAHHALPAFEAASGR